MKLYKITKNINNNNNNNNNVINYVVNAYKYNASSIKEWNNSIYNYNINNNAHLNIIDNKVRKLLKSYLNLFTKQWLMLYRRFLKIRRFKKLFLKQNKIYLSKLELKHTTSFVFITIYVFYSRNRAIKYLKNRVFKRKRIGSRAHASPALHGGHVTGENRNSLKNLVESIYKKKVNIRIVKLKYPYFNTSILVEYLVRRITSGRYRLLDSYRKILRRMKFVKIDKFIKLDKSKDKWKNLINMTSLNNISNISNILFKKKLNNLRCYIKELSIDLLLFTKNKALGGIKFEISGRLNRRRIAARSVNKVSQKGTIRNVYSSYTGLPSVLLRGSVRPNLDYHQLNSKTRNGSFNVKAWVASSYSTMSPASP